MVIANFVYLCLHARGLRPMHIAAILGGLGNL